MKNSENLSPKGIGGWLILLQVRMIAGLILMLFLPVNALLALLTMTALTASIGLFYRRCIGFRTAYVTAVLLGIGCIAVAPIGTVFLAVQAVLEAAIIVALFVSRRVRNTFSRRECEGRMVAADGWRGIERSRSCYDVYFIAGRCVR